MTTLAIIIFFIGYIAIALEHPLQLNKAASALLTGVCCWTIYAVSGIERELAGEQLLHHLDDVLIRMVWVVPQDHVITRLPLGFGAFGGRCAAKLHLWWRLGHGGGRLLFRFGQGQAPFGGLS